ncbi:family 78 glycoside hydrolase catalytic domain [Chitinophaga sedimenti]|uniref:alpha-L-rhamnosidase-related protein n=1 Tax=Chitinophaga sedimenti TaxID=2033606 RepID=UPI00200380EB|nr:alpha-L-rhamnosidase C-terminal domain-containing protein [Chitinophaga sedimenti]MCK7553680.1 family 78 glycoside hydrolase catalytic domain [Chitinophaga sedimenti]
MISITTFAKAQSLFVPDGLMCDLVAHADHQSVNGYLVQPGWNKEAFLSTQSVRIRNLRPAFSWMLRSVRPNVMQSAYRILVADHPDSLNRNVGNMWDTRKVVSAKSNAILYFGKPLQPNTPYYWKVMAWDTDSAQSDFPHPVVFFTDSVLTDYATARYPLQKTDQFPEHFTVSDTMVFADFGKAAFGQLKLELTATGLHDTVDVHIGEALTPWGTVNRRPAGTIRYQRYRIPLRSGTHTYQVNIRQDVRNTGPQAVRMPAYIGEVLPFRYCEIRNYKAKMDATEVVRVAVNYPFDETAASFYSSDTVLNKIWEMCHYTMKATSFAGIFVDGDRERIPYEADAYINQLGYYAADREFTLARASQEYLLHHATWPTEWILQSVLMAYNDYLYTGDSRSARHYYNDLKAKLLMPLEMPNGLISTRTGKQTQALMKAIHFTGGNLRDIVDWPHSGILGLGKGEGGETDGFVFRDYNAVVNAYYYKALRDMQSIATVLNRDADAKLFENKADKLQQDYRKLFWNKKQRVFNDATDTAHASLHTNMFALCFGLVEDKYKDDVAAFIRSRGVACSVYGSQFLMDAVYDGADEDYGLQLLTSTADRSWYNMIREGSTIAMEAWGQKFKPNQDWNHAWGAVPINTISRKLMGIEPITPGWEIYRIKPQISSLNRAMITVPTIKGTITAVYEKSGDDFLMTLGLPPNATAQVVLPARYTKGRFEVFIGEDKIKPVKKDGAYIVTLVGGGDYKLSIGPR